MYSVRLSPLGTADRPRRKLLSSVRHRLEPPHFLNSDAFKPPPLLVTV